MANIALKTSPIHYVASNTALPSCMPELKQGKPPVNTAVVMAYDSQKKFIGYSDDVAAIRKYIYSRLVYKTKKEYKGERWQANRRSTDEYWIIWHVPTHQAAMALVERYFYAADMIDATDKAAQAELILKEAGKANMVTFADVYGLTKELKTEYASTRAQMLRELDADYDKKIRSHLKDIIDGQAVLNSSPLNIDV